MVGPYEFLLKFVWTNGPESSLKVSVLTLDRHWSMKCSSLLRDDLQFLLRLVGLENESPKMRAAAARCLQRLCYGTAAAAATIGRTKPSSLLLVDVVDIFIFSGRGPGGCLQRIWGGGGGAEYFFRGRNARQVFV